MPRYAARTAAPPGTARAPASAAPGRRPGPPQRPPLWHVLQLRAAQSASAEAAPARPSRDGLPAALKASVEGLSGISMDDVRVHRNSPEPARLGALAYAQGSDIHIGPGQERHLPHEAWHVVQQKQGRVQATPQARHESLNDDRILEAEADAMGARAAAATASLPAVQLRASAAGAAVIQYRKADPPAAKGCTDPKPMGETQGVSVATPLWLYGLVDTVDHKNRASMLARVAQIYGDVGQQAAKLNFLDEKGIVTICDGYSEWRKNPKTAPQAIVKDSAKYEITNQNWDLIEETAQTRKAGNLSRFRDKKFVKSAYDPFAVDIQSFYADEKHSDVNTNYISLIVQFAAGFPGYVIEVSDDSLDVSHGMDERPRYDESATGPKKYLGTYSSKHHVANKPVGAYIDQIGPKSTMLEAEQGVDAITKVVAEGGRFEAVRMMGMGISDNTIFFVTVAGKDDQGDKQDVKSSKTVIQGITFRDLWLSWGGAFGGKYRIPVSEVRRQVRSGKIMASPLVGGNNVVQTFPQGLPQGANHFDLDKNG